MTALPGITIRSKIYESSASLVYRGIREQDGREVVVKLLKQDYPSPQELTRYRQEYEITSSLNLEGVVKAYSQQDYQRTLVICLEDFGGESLNHWMQQPDFCPMPLSAFLHLAINVTNILGQIHAAGIIHKDINPSNIILNLNTGVIKVIDFSIATRFSRTNPTFRSPHVLEGTLAYLSPEQTGRMNRLLDYRTDFYSLGATFYHLITGQLPFATTDVLELVHCQIAKAPIPPHELNETIPKSVSDIVMKLMAKNAEDRYQSAWGIQTDLERCAQQLETTGQIGEIQLGLQDVSNQLQIPQKLYGRQAEIAALLTAFERVTEGEGDAERGNVPASPRPHVSVASAIMLVSGYSGIGKSALVQELYKPITAKRGYFVSGKFDQLQRNIPYSAIVDALQRLVQQLLSEPKEQVQQWRSRLLTVLGSNGQLIIDVIPEVELIVGKQPSIPKVGATEAQNRFSRVFQQFVQVFCSEEHPLVIFLDDLQWIDAATLKLIELIVLDDQVQHLLLIGAYRNNEINPTHPLTLTLERLRKQGAVLQEIVLAPLTLEPLCQLIAETLHQDTYTVRDLAELVLRKTEGNPFFVSEFLQMLYRENLLTFNTEHLCWQWDMVQLQAQYITDNVVELLLSQLRKLPENTQYILQLAACIGAEFDLDTLSIVCEQSAQAISQDLMVVIQTGLIQPLDELDNGLLVQQYKFSHDRVQQAAYALIDEIHKRAVHLEIGRSLLKEMLPDQLSERLFEIVDHLNHGVELITDQSEREQIARLNLLAGQKAKVAIAYNMAKNYLASGREWLEASSWQTNYALTLQLYLETTEIEFLCGEFEQVEFWSHIVLQEAKTILDLVKVYEIKIQACIAQNRPLQAIDTALQILQQLGISFPEAPTQFDIQQEFDTVTSLLGERSIEDLIHLPNMTEPDKLAAIQILSRIMVVAYISAPHLMPLLTSKQVNLSIQYGNAVVSSIAYASFGVILYGITGNIEAGYEFGELALKLLSQPNTYSLKARTLYLVHYFITHRKKHIKESLEPLLEGYQSGLETGDLEFSSYCAYAYCFHSFAIGKQLAELENEIKTYSEATHQIKQKISLTWFQILYQTVLSLVEDSDNPMLLTGEVYNEKDKLLQQEIDGFVIFFVHFSKLFLGYLFSQYTEAIKNSKPAKDYVLQGRTTPLEPLYYLYDSLAKLATYLTSTVRVQEEILTNVAFNQEKLRQWAQYAPMNHLHKYHLVEAEKARILVQLFEAEEFYEQAIQGAKENGYIQEEALAYELAAKHYLARGRQKIAQTYMREAHYCYERWGASAKVKDIETCYPQFFPQTVRASTSSTGETTSNHSDIALDLATVVKASQAISREIELEQLLHSLMQVLGENAGAQTGFLILENSGEWVIKAFCEFTGDEDSFTTRVLQSLPIADQLPESIINYVIRTQGSVILNDATREGNFINELYIQRHQTRSLLCLPLLNQSKLVGVLYLENQLATGVFTPERTQLLHLLSAQAAIAIENAKLYSKLRENENRMAQFLEAVPVAIGVVDAAGRPYYANQRRIQLVGKGIDPAITPEQFAEVYQFYQSGTDQKYPTENLPIIRALRGERVTVDDMEIRRDDAIIPIEAWGTPVFDEQGNMAYAIVAFQDITERKQTEKLLADYNCILEQQVAERTAALRASEAELRAREQELLLITDALPAGISYIDANQRHRFVNRICEVWFNCNRDQILGKSILELIGEEAYQIVEPYINQVLAGQTTTYEMEIPLPSGRKYISAILIPDFDTNTQVIGFYALITDMSEQRNAALRERKRAEEAAVLEERNRMAREIHDTLAQAFTGILVQVGGATQVLTDDTQATQAHLDMIDELARTGLTEARRSVTALRPQLLEEGDLSSALQHLVTQMRSTTDTALVYEVQGTAYPLRAEIENNLLRIGQEGLTNAVKYANATEIRIELIYESIQCSLRVKDNGRGFGVGSVSSSGGFGLLGMSERAERIGAQLTIQSQPGHGTEIVVIVNRG